MTSVKRMIKLILLALLISSTDQFFCTYENNIVFSTVLFSMEKLNEALQRITGSTQNCQIEIEMNYTASYLNITFGLSSSSDGKVSTEIQQLETTFILDSPVPTIVNQISISCSRDNGCNRDLIFDLSVWLWKQNYTELQTRFGLILIKDKNAPINCINEFSSQNTIKCKEKHRVCSLRITYTIDKPDLKYLATCAGPGRRYTRIVINAEKNTSETTNKIVINCMFNQCNNKMISADILSTIRSLYNGSYLIETQFPLNISSMTTERMSTIIRTTSTTTTTHRTKTVNHDTIIDNIEETTPIMNNGGQTAMWGNKVVLLRYLKSLIYFLFYLICLL